MSPDNEPRAANATTALKRILFVDDDQNILEGMGRTLLDANSDFEMVFATSAQEALRKLAESEFDVVVADMHMPEMGGADLLTEVMRFYPQTVRILLSDNTGLELVIRSSTTAHQFLTKPCDAATLRRTLDRALRIREMLASPGLRTVVSRMTSLPSLPAMYTKLVASLDDPEITSRELGEIIAQDVGMTAKILQIANSAFFGLYRYVANPSEAAVYLGIDTIRALTLSTSVFSAFQEAGLNPFFIGQLQQHSMATGMVAHSIAKAESLPKKACDASLVGGLLHDAGKLVLAANCPKEYADVLALMKKERRASYAAESQIFGATHAEIGAYLLWLWGLPDEVCRAVAFHHQPRGASAKAFTAAAAIHVANALEHEREAVDTILQQDIDLEFLKSLGLASRLPEWRRLCSQQLDKKEEA
ncbi:MAG TPA: response regulator [Bryobacteraceae bacterium]|nr:response regulator [Bryobacteraceae bacterium]